MDALYAIKCEVEQKMKNDPAHDFTHTMRVYNNAKRLCMAEGVDGKLVLCAALLHDVVSFPKSSDFSKFSAEYSARESRKIMKKYDFTDDEIQIVCDAVQSHSFSAKQIPHSMEGKILQDADRLDAIGAIGIARVFTVGGSEKRQLYHRDDPFCKEHTPDDKKWTLDHFYKKLLLLESMMNTKSAKKEAAKRTIILGDFLSQLYDELYP
ncbi:MAG: HD domain-containing protein [Thaumarchaeota archaeon]|nr:HD domain-containing protein [Nitrososphaerota archaeon]